MSKEKSETLAMVTMIDSITLVGKFVDSPSNFVGLENSLSVYFPTSATETVSLKALHLPFGLINKVTNKTTYIPIDRVLFLTLVPVNTNKEEPLVTQYFELLKEV